MAVVTLMCVCCTMIPGNGIGAEGAKALAPALGHLTQLTELNLGGEYDDGCEGRGWECMCVYDVCLLVGLADW